MQSIVTRRARAICTRVTKKLDGYAALVAFGSSGEVQTSFLGETRRLEAAKANLLTARSIDQDCYWDIVRLAAFAESHADDGFSVLKTVYKKQKKSPLIEASQKN